jgi:integrase
MNTMTKYGAGSIRERNGKFLVTVYVDGRPKTLGTYPTFAEAESRRRGWLALRASSEVEVDASTLGSFGKDWLDRRELNGARSIRTDRNRWKKHVLTAPFIDLPLEALTRATLRAWVDKLMRKRAGDRRDQRSLSRQTVEHCVNLVRSCLRAAVDDEIITRNPADGIRVPRLATADPGWTYLTPTEQTALLTHATIPESERVIIAFSLGTGLRQGEQWALELRDLHVEGAEPHVYVRWGSAGKPPKNGHARRVPLNGLALAAGRRWLELLPDYLTTPKRTYANEHELVFPTARGCRRRDKKPLRAWARYLAMVGLDKKEQRHDRRSVRWHDLRHTCASSLVAGWWGRAWRLDEVRDVLGHSSVTTTERYAHLAPSVLARAAAETTHLVNRDKTASDSDRLSADSSEFARRATLDSNQWPSAPEAE